MMQDKDGKMRELCIRQGYVPTGCTMDGFMIMAFVSGGDDPCKGCNESREKCKGRCSTPNRFELPGSNGRGRL
jgi:hypothetical protein